jgi:hypothetical protein
VKNVGFLFNCSMKTNPRVRLSPSLLNRVALIDAALREADMRVFFYSPKHVTEAALTVPGYVLEEDEFVPTTSEVPLVNGNWTYQTRRLLDKGMGYRRFVDWAEERGIGVYVPYAFSELVHDKYETYKLVRAHHETLHPYCEPYRRSARQLQRFLESSTSTFIKPRAGSKGNGITTLKRERNGLSVSFYQDGRKQRFEAQTIGEASEFVRRLTRGETRYVIEHGIDTLPYGDCVFDIRVVMVHDGSAWTWFQEARLSRQGSDVSNLSQGGSSIVTEDLLHAVLGAEAAQQKFRELESEAFALAVYLDKLHPGELMEVAFDFVLDHEARLQLVEINTKPGLLHVGFMRKVFDSLPDEEPLFERWVYPHTSALARFLRDKLERRGA